MLKRFESILIKMIFIQFMFLVIAQALLLKKEWSPYLSRTIFAEGVLTETFQRTIQILDQLQAVWYYI